MRVLSDTCLLLTLIALLAGAAWPWWLGGAALGLLIRPGMPWLAMLLGAIYAGQ